MGGRQARQAPQYHVIMTAEEKQVVEAASRTPDLLRHLNVPMTFVRGALRHTGKLGSIAVAALKLLLHVFSYVGTDPATRQLSMQEFRLPHFVPPSSPPPVQPAWTTQTVSVVMQTVAYAQHLANRALAAIALSAQAISETEMLMMQYEGLVEAAVSSTAPPRPPGPRTTPQPPPVSSAPPPPASSAPPPPPAPPPGAPRLQPPLSCVAHHPRRPHTHLHHARTYTCTTPACTCMCTMHRRLERCSALSGDPAQKFVTKCSANFPHPLHALRTPHPLDYPLATLGAQADRERALSEELRLARLELGLKERWHASELKHRGEVAAARMEKAERERRVMGRREAALKEAQAALRSVEVRTPRTHARVTRTHEPAQKLRQNLGGPTRSFDPAPNPSFDPRPAEENAPRSGLPRLLRDPDDKGTARRAEVSPAPDR